MKNLKKQKGIVGPVIIILLCALIYGNIHITCDLVPNGLLYIKNEPERGITVKDILLCGDEVSAVKKTRTTPDHFSESLCTCYYVWGNVDAYAGGTLLYGDWELKPGQAVIAEETAILLFKRSDCIGYSFSLNGNDYVVSGVYRNSGGIWRDLSEDGTQTVFISMREASLSSTVDLILFTGKEENTTGASVAFDQRMNGKLSSLYTEENLYAVHKMIEEIPFFALLIVSVFAVLYAFWRLACILTTPKDRERKRKLVCELVFLIFLLICSFLFLCRQIFIPAGLLVSPEYIFHPDRYTLLILSWFQQYNFCTVRFWLMNLCFFTYFIEIVLFVPFVWATIKLVFDMMGMICGEG